MAAVLIAALVALLGADLASILEGFPALMADLAAPPLPLRLAGADLACDVLAADFLVAGCLARGSLRGSDDIILKVIGPE